MRRRIAGLAGGLIVLLLGVMFLLANLGHLDMSVWALLLRFWPLMLIIGGVVALVGGTFRWFVVVLLALAIVLGTVGAPLVRDWATGPLSHATYTPPAAAGTLASLKAEIELEVPSLRVNPPVEAAYLINIAYRGPDAPQVSFEPRGGDGHLTVRQAGRPQSYVWGASAPQQVVDLAFQAGLPLDLAIKCGVANANLDLCSYSIRSLDLSTGVGNLVVRLGQPTGSVRVQVATGVGSVHLDVPAGVAVRVVADAGIGSREIEAGARSGDTWTDQGFEAAADRYEIKVAAGVGRVVLRRR
jgi:hypothetical protein